MGRERRAEQPQPLVALKLTEDIEDMVGVFADILVADIAKACPNAAGFGLYGLFVVHEAGVVVPFELRGQVAEKGRDVPPAVFHHRDPHAVQRQRGEGRLDRRLLSSVSVEMKTSVSGGKFSANAVLDASRSGK